MSTFVYKCFSCETYQDVEKKPDDEPIIKCECGETMERIVTGGNFSLKGSGFHKNDYK